MVLITATMAMLLVTALGAALVLLSVTETGISANERESTRAFYAAEAGLHHAVALIAASDDWTPFLAGSAVGIRDGTASGARRQGGTRVDLDQSTALWRCGRSAGCTEVDRTRATAERPWGANNPSWQLIAWGPLGRFVPGSGDEALYVTVWIGDDPDETDGDPLTDEPRTERPGYGAVRLLSQAFGPVGARRAVEALVVRERAVQVADGTSARPARTRMLTWREVR